MQDSTNCYAYAINKKGPFEYKSKSGMIWEQGGANPGYYSGNPFIEGNKITVPEIRKRAIDDGLSPIPIDKSYPVFLKIDPGKDYHWYRMNPDGTWSHKPGKLPATNKDSSGKTIKDPEKAKHPYPVNGGYLWVPENF